MSEADKLAARLPVFGRVQRLLEAIAQSDSQYSDEAESLLLELSELEIERTHDEAIAEGVLTVRGKDGRPVAWIV